MKKSVEVGIVLLVLFALLSNFQLLYKAARFDFQFIEIDEYENRFENLKKALPSRGVVGYMTDREPLEISQDVIALAAYYLIQYSLAPLIVVNSLEHNLIIGNFYETEVDGKILEDKGLILVKDFGDGIMLIKRQNK